MWFLGKVKLFRHYSNKLVYLSNKSFLIFPILSWTSIGVDISKANFFNCSVVNVAEAPWFDANCFNLYSHC